MKNSLAVYVHLPFCKKKCYYCDFLSFSSSPELRKKYLNALIEEAVLYRELIDTRGVSSLYLGGGTPSMLDLRELDYLLTKLFEILKPQGELSFEMNPDDVDGEKISLIKSYGDFRYSLGAQGFDDRLLSLFGRTHDVEAIYRAVDVLGSQGVENFSLDLIYAVAEEFTMEKNLEAVARLKPSHLSCYALELHPTRPLARLIEQAPEEIYQRDFTSLKQGLKDLGYLRYEISSFAKDDSYSRHNLNYWKGGDYLGLGLGAHGFLRPYRYSNIRNIKSYMEELAKGRLPLANKQALSPEEERFEAFMLGLRCTQGIRLDDLKPLLSRESQAIEKHKRLGLIEVEGSKLRLTEEGFDLFNYVLVDFL